MAFLKTFKHTCGIDMSYWRIVKVDIDYCTEQGTILLYGYYDQAARDSGSSHLGYKTVRFDNKANENKPALDHVFDNYFSITKINGSGKNPIRNAYVFLKSIPEGDFINAMDIIE